MSVESDWLPPLVYLSDYDGDWSTYVEAIYEHFKNDFVYTTPIFRGIRLGLKRHPVTDGKEATFWHFISEGLEESDRNPNFRRCERIRWPRPIIEHENDPRIKLWRNKRKGSNRILLWFESEEYLVILADRGRYILPWTAYTVTTPHRKRKLQKEYEEYLRINT